MHARKNQLIRLAGTVSVAIALGGVMLGTVGSVGQQTASAAPRTAPRTAPRNLHFGVLPLQSGWRSEQSAYGSGTPGVAKDSNGIVYLNGSLANTGSDETAFYLPTADRPTHNLYMLVYSEDGEPGIFYVGASSGAGELYDGYVDDYASLAGISFPGPANTGLPVKTLTLQNGWSSEQKAYGTGAPAVSRSPSGIVYLQGSMAGGKTGKAAFTLPSADRPAKVDNIIVYTSGGSSGDLEVLPSGTVEMIGNGASGFTSLAGVSFPSATATGLTKTSLKTINGWHYNSSSGTGAVGVARTSGGIVYLSGSMAGGTTNTVNFTIPAVDRPTHNLYMPVETAGGLQGSIEIETDGVSYVFDGHDTTQTSLAGLSYSVTS